MFKNHFYVSNDRTSAWIVTEKRFFRASGRWKNGKNELGIGNVIETRGNKSRTKRNYNRSVFNSMPFDEARFFVPCFERFNRCECSFPINRKPFDGGTRNVIAAMRWRECAIGKCIATKTYRGRRRRAQVATDRWESGMRGHLLVSE